MNCCLYLIKLSDFTSLFEVSIAIHLLYSLIPEVQRIFLANTNIRYRYFQSSIDSCKRSLERFENEKKYALQDDYDKQVDRRWDKMDIEEKEKIKARRIEHSRKEREFRDLFTAIDFHQGTYDMEIMTLDKIAVEKQDKYIPISMIIALFSLTLIIVAGFFPDWQFQWYFMLILILITILPMPLMIFLTYRRSRRSIKELRKAVEKLGIVTFAHAMGEFDKVPNRGL